MLAVLFSNRNPSKSCPYSTRCSKYRAHIKYYKHLHRCLRDVSETAVLIGMSWPGKVSASLYELILDSLYGPTHSAYVRVVGLR